MLLLLEVKEARLLKLSNNNIYCIGCNFCNIKINFKNFFIFSKNKDRIKLNLLFLDFAIFFANSTL